ncbi:MAG: DUF1854 domain-containing protein [Candidatus Omnitrophica bacterium]|nr:DUF1854 domain-containing protein [Candidatus Omnitrophota bacterium]MCM8776782.1 DUF1854 domain-containing protein [Candidatus Omnitrophota bacterium]
MEEKKSRLEEIEVRALKPEEVKIFRGAFNLMHVMIANGILYRGVYAIRAFPIRYPDKYIFLFYYDENDRVQEIGMIEDLNIFPEETRQIILDAMRKQYFAYTIESIYSIKLEFGVLHFEVETDKGQKTFYMRWASHRTLDFGERGKILLDIFDDRYILPNIEKLTKTEQDLFTRYIYW